MAVLTAKTARNQVNTVLPDDLFDLVSRMSEALEVPRAEILRQLAEQGVTALRAAARAEDSGRDTDAAAVMAVQQAAVDGEVVRRHCDALGDYLTGMLEWDPRGAVQLARGAAGAIQRWADLHTPE